MSFAIVLALYLYAIGGYLTFTLLTEQVNPRKWDLIFPQDHFLVLFWPVSVPFALLSGGR
jgi:hypothetical protein